VRTHEEKLTQVSFIQSEEGDVTINMESEGEVVDDPDAELMLLLVDHKSKGKVHIKFKSRHEKEDWLELIVNAKEEMGSCTQKALAQPLVILSFCL
jgi:hypothetical protein